MTDHSYWLLFFATALLLNLSPGPDLIYILSRSIAHGRRVGVASALGTCTGALVHVAAAALGLSALLATSAVAFSVVKYVGAAYLVVLGVKAFRSGTGMVSLQTSAGSTVAAMQAFRQGMLIDVLNPKVAIFFMALLPQFVRPAFGNVPLQILTLGLLIIVVSIVVECTFALLAGQAGSFIRRHPVCSLWLDRMLGSVFIMLGVRLAFAEKNA